jgi:bacillithiol biosynthesis deacetylase BshB1
VVDLSRGEMGSRGNAEIRHKESLEASKILGLKIRENIGLKDTQIESSLENRLVIAKVIRKYRAKILLVPHSTNLHPDHRAASSLIMDSLFCARLRKFNIPFPPFAPSFVLKYPMHGHTNPSFVVDVTDVFHKKMEAIRCYASQFLMPPPKDFIQFGIRDYMVHVESMCRFYGSMIGVQYGEPLFIDMPIKLQSLSSFLGG